MISVYLIIILCIGFYRNKHTDNNDYLFASRKLTLPSFIATIVTTWYGAILEVGRYTFYNVQFLQVLKYSRYKVYKVQGMPGTRYAK